jgi:hypothetical protein
MQNNVYKYYEIFNALKILIALAYSSLNINLLTFTISVKQTRVETIYKYKTKIDI